MNIKDIINKHQKQAAHFDFEEKERDFIKLSDLEEKYPKATHNILAIFINTESKFGAHPTIVTDDYNVNLPKHLLDLSESIRSDDDAVQAINERKIGFKIYKYKFKQGREGYSINLVSLDQSDDDDDLPF